uniref:Uncharacterized protein n=1 Tax=viral metagenome TaxID=1070528 RepID=A0A6C0BCJ1_9ZZZZ
MASAELLRQRQQRLSNPVASVKSAIAPVPAAQRVFTPGRSATYQPAAVSSIAGTIVAGLFYLSSAIFIIFLIAIFVHFTVTPIFKFSPYDKGILNIQTMTAETAWTSVPPAFDLSANVANPVSSDYTVSLDVFVSSQFSSNIAPRVLLYRGKAPVTLPVTAKEKDLATLFPNTNLLVYVDNMTNDLNVVATATNKEAISPIKNIPLNTPFKLTIVYMPSFMEVYINGKLQATRVFKTPPITSTYGFWPPPKSVDSLVKVGNFTFWPDALPSSTIRESSSIASSDFFTKVA